MVDTSPCLSQIKAGISEPGLRFALYEPVEFIRHFLVDKLEFSKVGVNFTCGRAGPGRKGVVSVCVCGGGGVIQCVSTAYGAQHGDCQQLMGTVGLHGW